MDGKTLARLGAVIFVAIAVTATAIEMTRQDEPPANSATPMVAPSAPDPLREGQRRCQRLGEASARDAELNRRAVETDLRLKRLYDAIESGVADISDPALKDRITGLKAFRDQAQVDAERAQAMLESSGNRAVTPAAVRRFADVARQRIRIDGGGYRRDHLRAFAQRVEVGETEVRIMGSKGELLRTLTAVSSGKSAAIGVPSLGLKWRRDSPRSYHPHSSACMHVNLLDQLLDCAVSPHGAC